MTDVAIALSGGGAAGLGHIPVLEGVDDLGIRPIALAGSSMGALMGAAYAAGLSGAEMRAHVMRLIESPSAPALRLWRQAGFGGIGRLLALDTPTVVELVLPDTVPERFEDLATPLTVIATDFHARRQRQFKTGPLRAALAASIAIPGVFRPVELDGRVYVDGGVSNNLAVDCLPPGAFKVAVDVSSDPADTIDAQTVPSAFGATLGSLHILIAELVSARLSLHPPDVLLCPESRRYAALEFHKTLEILEISEPARAETAAALGPALRGKEMAAGSAGDIPKT